MYAYWSASDLLGDFTPGTVNLRLPTPPHATIDAPVLVDPLSQRVYRVEGKAEAGSLAISLPKLDYPLIITDRSVVPM